MDISADNVMLIITSIYVIATIAIFFTNNASAKATRDQVSVTAKQMQRSTELQLLDRRLGLLKELEKDDTFIKHDPLLDILFPDQVIKLEKELIEIRTQRQAILQSFLIDAVHVGLNNFGSEKFSKVNSINSSVNDIQSFITPIQEQASKIIAPSGKPFLEVEKGIHMEEDALADTKIIEQKKREFFDIANSFIKETLS